MKIQVKFFGQLRDLTETGETNVELPEGRTVQDLAHLLSEQFPRIGPYLGSVSFAVNNEYVKKDTHLSDGSEVGLLPPISGG